MWYAPRGGPFCRHEATTDVMTTQRNPKYVSPVRTFRLHDRTKLYKISTPNPSRWRKIRPAFPAFAQIRIESRSGCVGECDRAERDTRGRGSLALLTGDDVTHVPVSPNCPCLECASSRMHSKSEVESGAGVSLISFSKSSLSSISCVCARIRAHMEDRGPLLAFPWCHLPCPLGRVL